MALPCLVAPLSSATTLTLSKTLPNGTTGAAYTAAVTVKGGPVPYQFALASGTLPTGITLNSFLGTLTGTPTSAGSYSFEISVTNLPKKGSGSQNYTVVISGSSQGGGIGISVSPSSATLGSGTTQQFTASVTGTSNTAVTWSASSGSISSTGLYTAPQVTSSQSTTITATTKATPSVSAQSSVTVNPTQNGPLQITNTDLPPAEPGSSYDGVLVASGGTTPYTWSLASGNPPSGISLSSYGALTGTTSATGSFNFSVTVTDAKQNTATAAITLPVVQGNGYDGPAQLPIATVVTSMSNSPAPGSVINVSAGQNLQTALNQAACGDTIELQAGATFSGQFVLPANNCNSSNWIIIRTSSPDTALPAEGQRLTPCYAGVASLVGRPAYTCSSPQNVLARVQQNQLGDGPFQFANGANFYRIIGLEITRASGTAGPARLLSFQGTADHIFVDRSWLHGQANDETYNGVAASGGTNIAVIDSYLSDFHCISVSGSCTDAHAVSGGVSNSQDGPYLIQDNFLEASGEEIMFGGGPATATPADITIQNNHFWKPWQWMPGSAGFVGGPTGNPFIVKNHIELKNAARVLVQANLMENNWGGFTQDGFSVVLTPKNQFVPQSNTNVCPTCQVTDVTLRYNQISHAGAGIQLASSNSDGGAPALAAARFSLHDLVVDDISTKYTGGGSGFEIDNSWPSNPINTITINHVTIFPASSSHLLITGNPVQNPAMSGLVYTNSLTLAGQYPIWNAIGSQGGTSCAVKDSPIPVLSTCFTSYTFQNNAIIAPSAAFPASVWPTGNFFPSSPVAVQFTNYNGGIGGNYQLLSASPYKNAGTDGKDLGADIVGLQQQLAGVE